MDKSRKCENRAQEPALQDLTKQEQLFYISKDNKFSRIYNFLLEVEKNITISYSLYGPKKVGVSDASLRQQLITIYIVSIKTVLEFSLVFAHIGIQYDKDLLIVDKKIVELMRRINNHPLYERKWSNDMASDMEKLNNLEGEIMRKYLKENPDIIKWYRYSVGILRNFKKDFLSEK